MNTEKTFKLNHHAVIALAITAAFPATSIAAAGRVEFAIGGATAISASGASRQLAKGGDINSGDTIKTTDGRVQVRFTDGGYMSFQPNTEFRIENYNYDGKQDGSERGFFRLVEGGLRAITGIVGRNNRPAYRVATPVATIGIRGSEFYTEFKEKKLKTRVNGGSIFVQNEFGNLILFKGQSSETEEGKKPKYSEEESGVLAKGPKGGGEPDKGQNQSKEEQEQAKIFTVNEQYTEEGVSCALTASCGSDGALAGVIASYAAQNAVGEYSGSGTISGLNSGITGTASGSLYAQFGTYSVSNFLDLSVTDGASYFASASLSGSGSIGANGSISLPTMTGGGSLCDGSCLASGSGAFSGAHAETATINYGITSLSSGASTSGQASATVNYNAYYIAADGGEGAVLYENFSD